MDMIGDALETFVDAGTVVELAEPRLPSTMKARKNE